MLEYLLIAAAVTALAYAAYAWIPRHWMARRRKTAPPLSVYFDLEEFDAKEIAEILGMLSDLYRSVGGDGLVIESTKTATRAELKEMCNGAFKA